MTNNAPLPSLEDLKKKLAKAHNNADSASEKKDRAQPGGLRIGADLVAGVIVGSVAGYFLDSFFGTKPVLFLICFCLGAFAGGLNIYKATVTSSSDEKNSTSSDDSN